MTEHTVRTSTGVAPNQTVRGGEGSRSINSLKLDIVGWPNDRYIKPCIVRLHFGIITPDISTRSICVLSSYAGSFLCVGFM